MPNNKHNKIFLFLGVVLAFCTFSSAPGQAAAIQDGSLTIASASIANNATNVPTNIGTIVLTLGAQDSIKERVNGKLYKLSKTGAYVYQKTLTINWASPNLTVELGGQLNPTSPYRVALTGKVVTKTNPFVTPQSSTFTYVLAFTTSASPVNGDCGTMVNSCSTGTIANSSNNGVTSTWACDGSYGGSTATCHFQDPISPTPTPVTPKPAPAPTPTPISTNPPPTPVSPPITVSSSTAASKLGVNISDISDWDDRSDIFVDVMKNARGFASLDGPWDPINNPVPLDANGWPTTDFGVYFLTTTGDPLNRPASQEWPSLVGTYTLSFTGQGTVNAYNCCIIQNQQYNAATNTTTAQVVVGPNDSQLSLTFINTNGGVKNLKLLRPGYPLGTTQVFTTEFLNTIQPFSTLRFMETLNTNGSQVTSWAMRTLPTAPTQQQPAGIAWEYIIQLANTSGKDIWINIPEGVDLTDTTTNNYITQLATLMKESLDSNIHVYVEYSNELWNTQFSQTTNNLNSAISDINSGADKTLNYDAINNQYYWGYRRVVHQLYKISQLFANVYGQAAINTTIRPVYMSQFVQPYLTEDGLAYLNTNFGAPNKFIYAIGGAPYFSGPETYSDLNSLFAGLQAGLTQTLPGFNGTAVPYTGGINYNIKSTKSLANFYNLKNVTYEGGPDVSSGFMNSGLIDEEGGSDSRVNPLVQNELADWYGCGNDLFVYYALAKPPANIFGAYEDISLPTARSAALLSVAATPLSSYNSCQ